MKQIGEDIETYVSLVGIYDKYVEDVKPSVYFLGLIGEVSELCGAIDDVNAIDDNDDKWQAKVVGELGDILWYWFGLTKNLKLDYTRIWNQIYNEQVAIDTHKTGGTEILQLVASAGRITEHLKKSIRDDGGKITPERLEKIEQKLADTLELIFVFCQSLNVNPYTVLQKNYDKLFARNEAGTLQGEGDGVTKEERT